MLGEKSDKLFVRSVTYRGTGTNLISGNDLLTDLFPTMVDVWVYRFDTYFVNDLVNSQRLLNCFTYLKYQDSIYGNRVVNQGSIGLSPIVELLNPVPIKDTAIHYFYENAGTLMEPNITIDFLFGSRPKIPTKLILK